MAQPMLPFLRPLGLPTPATVRYFLRFSTSTRCRAQAAQSSAQSEDPNLIASRTASPSYPPQSLKSLPRPKESHASHRTSHPPKKRDYPTRQLSYTNPSASTTVTEPITPLAAHKCAPNLPYFITRTPSNELPIYSLQKRGGNLKMTRIKKIDGKRDVLRDELRSVLGLPEKECVINETTGHIMMKGWHRPKVERFLKERMF